MQTVDTIHAHVFRRKESIAVIFKTIFK